MEPKYVIGLIIIDLVLIFTNVYLNQYSKNKDKWAKSKNWNRTMLISYLVTFVFMITQLYVTITKR